MCSTGGGGGLDLCRWVLYDYEKIPIMALSCKLGLAGIAIKFNDNLPYSMRGERAGLERRT